MGKNDTLFKMKNLEDNEVKEFNYSNENRYLIYKNEVNTIILDLDWTNDGVVFSDPFSKRTRYQMI